MATDFEHQRSLEHGSTHTSGIGAAVRRPGTQHPDVCETGQIVEPRAHAGTAVLVVDDNDVVRALLKWTLSGWGHSVDVAADGADALRCLSERAYDVILTDIQMPLMDGISLWRRAVEAGHPGTWILMTASAAPRLERTLPILHKPFRLLELKDMLERAVLVPRGHSSANAG